MTLKSLLSSGEVYLGSGEAGGGEVGAGGGGGWRRRGRRGRGQLPGQQQNELQRGDKSVNLGVCLILRLTWGLSLPGLPQVTGSGLQETEVNSRRTLHLCEPTEENEFRALGIGPLRGTQLL